MQYLIYNLHIYVPYENIIPYAFAYSDCRGLKGMRYC